MPQLPVLKHPLNADHAQLYDLLISELTDFAVFLMDPAGQIVTWNPGVERLLGYPEEEWLGRPINIIFTPEDQAEGKIQQEVAVAATERLSPDVRWHVRRDGTRIFAEGSLTALRGDQGRLIGFSKVMRDITERKKREEQLQDALSYSESIIDTVSEALLVLDGDLRVRSANRSFYQTFRTTKAETENRPIYELGNGQWNAPRLRVLLEEILPKQNTIENFEVEHDFPVLGHKVMRLNARRLWRQGTQSELTLVAIEDITDQKRAEKALAESEKHRRLIMDTAPAIVSYVDRDLRYRLANDTYERWFGIAPADLIGKSVLELFGSSFFPQIQPYLDRVLAGETVTFEEEYPDVRNGSRTLQLTYTPDFDERGEVQGFIVLGSDTTARKQAETALRESEERWRGLFERMAEGFFVGEIMYGPAGEPSDFRIVEVNPAFEKLTGLREAAGKTAQELFPDVKEILTETYAHVVKTGEPAQFELCIPTLNNSWFEARARHTDGDRFAVLFLDITERKNAELQIRESERRQAALVSLGDQLRDLKDLASLTSAGMEIVGKTLDVARAGYGKVDEKQEFVTVETDWTNGCVSSLTGTYRFEDFGEDFAERLRRGEAIVISDISTHEATAKDSERWKALNIRAVINLPLIEGGRLVALLFVQDSKPRTWTDADITFIRKVADRTWIAVERARALAALQQSEEFSRSVLASSPDCVKIVDLEGRLLTMNEGGCRQLEVEDLAAFVNRPWAELWSGSKELAEQAICKAKDGETSRFQGFCPTIKGTPKWWEVVVTPVRDAAGRPVRILSLSRDITERQRDEEERERLTKELKRSNEELSQFAHIVAHDLQSPLRGVMSFAQLLHRKAEGTLGPPEVGFLDQIVENARRMQELVQAVLRFAQVGHGTIEKKPVEMEAVLDSALQSLQTQIEEKGATIEHGVLPRVTGDSIQLVQLLQNLISNALKYHRPNERPSISIQASEEGSHYVFTVEDNGEGIAAEYLDMIFEPLRRLHGAEVPGTGLGLAVCQRIVDRHNGRIWVESQPGVGSRFYFMLPVN